MLTKLLLAGLLLGGCTGSRLFVNDPAALPPMQCAYVGPPVYTICGSALKPVGPSSQGSFTEPKRH